MNALSFIILEYYYQNPTRAKTGEATATNFREIIETHGAFGDCLPLYRLLLVSLLGSKASSSSWPGFGDFIEEVARENIRPVPRSNGTFPLADRNSVEAFIRRVYVLCEVLQAVQWCQKALTDTLGPRILDLFPRPPAGFVTTPLSDRGDGSIALEQFLKNQSEDLYELYRRAGFFGG
ncbi:MAG: hypothetical protein HQM15_08045 [Deltaproteobacteria bacterium]|nr:hypothetical protein [Deltaproteobacteria bacterium]